MSNHIGEPQRVVICAAIRFGDMLVLGPRHFDKTMNNMIDNLSPGYGALSNSDWEQGFVDQFGVFMNRYEALVVACEAEQINTHRYKTNPIDQLFSEDLY